MLSVKALSVQTLLQRNGTYLITRLCIQEDPTKLDDLGRVLGHIYAMLITSRSDVNNNVPIEIRWCRRGSRHFPEASQFA